MKRGFRKERHVRLLTGEGPKKAEMWSVPLAKELFPVHTLLEPADKIVGTVSCDYARMSRLFSLCEKGTRVRKVKLPFATVDFLSLNTHTLARERVYQCESASKILLRVSPSMCPFLQTYVWTT